MPVSKKSSTKVIAIVGDVHGHHHRMVSMLQSIEKKRNVSIVSVLQVGDFEAHRHDKDVSTMDAPQKYRKRGDFHHYHKGMTTFPWPLYFIGGNHEPYGWYEQHLEGAQLVKNCYYMGRVSAIQLEDYKIVGLTGIFHPESSGFQRPSIAEMGKVSNKSYGYYTLDDIEQALSFGQCDILMLHDWPKGIIKTSDYPSFLGRRRGTHPEEIGSELTFELIKTLQPKVVACGHRHYKYRNTIGLSQTIVEICCVANVEAGSDAVILLDEQLNVLA